MVAQDLGLSDAELILNPCQIWITDHSSALMRPRAVPMPCCVVASR